MSADAVALEGTRRPLAEQVEALRRLAMAATRPAGSEIYRDLVAEVARALNVTLAMVAVFADEQRTTMRTLAVVLNGKPLTGSVEYLLARSPCVEVVGKGYCFMPGGVMARYALDEMVTDLRLDAYAAFPMNDSHGQPLGLVAAMDAQAIAGGDADHAEAVLKIAALRLGAELERSAADAALRRSEASYRSIFDVAEDAIFVHDWDSYRFVDVNARAVENFGYTREELLTIDPSELMAGEPPYDMAHALAHLESAKQGRCPPFEWRTRLKDGRVQWQEVRLKPVVLDGRRQILAFTRDITERKASEERLRSSEEQYRAIFNASEDALVLWNDQFQRVDVNPAHVRLYGFARDELLGRAYERMPYPPEQAEARLALVRRAMDGETCRIEVPALRKDGRFILTELRAIPFQHGGAPHVLTIARDITERKAAEVRLREQEQRYRAIFDGSSDPIVLWNRRLEVVDVNAAFVRTTGFARGDIVGRHWSARADADDLHKLMPLIEGAIAGRESRAVERVTRADGSLFDIELRYLPMSFAGKPHALGIGRDISQSLQAEKALRDSEAQYRAIFNASADALVLRAADFSIVDVNATYEQMSGYRREEVLGVDRVLANPSEDGATIRALHARALAGETIALRTQLLRRDGCRYELELRGVPVEHAGRPHVLYIGRDISQAVHAERALRASEEQYRAIFNATADVLTLWNSGYRRVDVNPAYERLYGWTRDEVIGRGFDFPPYSHEHGKLREDLVRRALAGETVQAEHDVITKQGERRRAEVLAIPFKHGHEPHVLVITRDITERHEAERQRSELEHQLRQSQKMEAIGQLTGGIAHDFNNILTSVIGYLVLAQERAERLSDPALLRQLGSAHLAAGRARDLIAQMLAFARRQRGERRLLKLAPVVKQALQLLRSTLPASIALDGAAVGPGATLAPVHADAVQIEQVLFNLCINARDAMSGSGRITVRLHERGVLAAHCASCGKALEGGHWLEIEVNDSGRGIAPEVVDRMFEPFFTTKEIGRGTGMGLAMVHGIVHDHDGHVVVDTAPGRGTTFRVLLPAAQGAADATAGHGGPETLAGTPLRGLVMVVDDEPMVAAFMTELLEGWGLQVVALGDAQAAARWLEDGQHALDLLITDQTMPQMTGLDLAHHAAVLRPDLPVLLYSGNVEGMDDDALRRAGVRARLDKPVDPARLHSLLRQWLQKTTPAS
jgi:PAS domain S-box-containing protein